MARSKRWTTKSEEHGMWVIQLSSWRYLHDFVHQQMLNYEHYIWRGQRCDDWLLQPTIERMPTVHWRSAASKQSLYRTHLNNFKYAVRGRRGSNPARLESENEWWALGQHHGLSTPLLDWTHSPFLALYFAFMSSATPQTSNRTLFAINPYSVESRSNEIKEETPEGESPQICEFIRPLTDDNPRLVNQGGLFSRSPIGVDMESWMKEKYEKSYTSGVLIKLHIPNKGRVDCLRTLNRMNINHATLFPDIYGSSQFCNMRLAINKY